MALPLLLRGEPTEKVKSCVSIPLDQVGLSHRLGHHPHELSGGEQQRVAIARALVIQPKILLADEPTGNLDSTVGGEIMGLIKSLSKKDAITVILATHSQSAASHADYTIRLKDGRVHSQQ